MAANPWQPRRAALAPPTRLGPTGPGRPYGVRVRDTTGPGRGTWAALVRKVRGNMEISAFARRLGVDRGTVHRWETGQTVPRGPEVVQRFAALFGLDLDQTLTVAGLRPATDEVAPTPEMRWDPDVMELQRMLDDPRTPPHIKDQIRTMAATLRALAEAAQRKPEAPRRRAVG